MDLAIEVSDISKVYPLYGNPSDRLKELVHPRRRKYHKEFHALRNINLRIAKGECVGIIGLNGSGKSTLLQIIAGVVNPTSGNCFCKGKISALLELGAGFNPEASGLENARFQCFLLGVAEKDMPDKLREIVEFAEIGEHLSQPVKTYSSGMYVRLAFAVAIAVEPDIFIVDEALAVGDMYFQAKCMTAIRSLRRKGVTLLFVSHDAAAVKSLCDRAVLLHKGELIDQGPPEEVFNLYNNMMAVKEESRASLNLSALRKRYGTGEIRIETVRLRNGSGYTESIASRESVKIEIEICAFETLVNPTVGISIRGRGGIEVFGINNFNLGIDFGLIQAGNSYLVSYAIDMKLGEGRYSLAVAAHDKGSHVEECFDWWNDALQFEVKACEISGFSGFCAIDTAAKLEHLV